MIKQEKLLISRNVLVELREHFVNQHILRTIHDAFQSVGILLNNDVPENVSGERRTLVEQYYATLDLTQNNDLQKILRLIEQQILYCEVHLPETDPNPLFGVLTILEDEGYVVQNRKLIAITTPFSFQHIGIDHFTSRSIQQDWERMIRSIEGDPADAVTSARSMLESTCKLILEELSISYEDKWDLPKLYKETANALRLSPSGYDEELFKRILGGLNNICHGLAELRNVYGDAHGKGKKTYHISARHARLAVNAAGSLSVFLLETSESRT